MSSIRQLRQRALEFQWQAETDRARLARTVHDELTQLVTALKVGLSMFDRPGRHSSAQPERLAELQTIAGELARSVQGLAAALAPATLPGGQLAKAIGWLAGQSERALGIPVRCELADLQAEAETSRIALGIVEEALTNIQRHAQASEVLIRLRDCGASMSLEIRDNGLGFDPRRVKPHLLGIFRMRECLSAAGGRLTIRSRRGEGTCLRARIPQRPDKRGRT